MSKASYLSIDSVFPNEGLELKCRYLSMPEFDPDSEICQMLHYGFYLYASNIGYSSACNARLGLEEFLIFRKWYNQENPVALQLHTLSDLFTEPLKIYKEYLQKRKINIKAIYSLRNMLNKAPEYDESFPTILFPKLPQIKTKPQEALDDSAIHSLEFSLKEQIDNLYEKLEFRKLVHEAKAYDFEEVFEEFSPSGTKKNVYEWYRFALNNNANPSAIRPAGKIKDLRNLHPDFAAILCHEDPKTAFVALYDKESSNFLGETIYNPFERLGFRLWNPDLKRVLKTFLDHGYPFNWEYDAILKFHEVTSTSINDYNDIISLICFRFTTARPIQQKRKSTGVLVPNFDELLNLYYPNQLDMASLMLMMMLQVGWNKETVLDLDPNNFEHVLSGTIDEKQRLITAEKNKGQGSNLPYFNPKTMIAVSNTNDKYSLFNLVRLANELSLPLQQIPLEEAVTLNKKYSPLFCCIVDKADWKKKSRFSTMGNTKTSSRGVRDFLSKYEIVHGGTRLKTSSQILGKLRPTWVYLKRKTDPLSVVQMATGHASPVTTDIHYDNSPNAKKDREKRLSDTINDIGEKFKTRKLNGLLPQESNEQSDSKTIVIFSIPGHKRELWGCSDQTNPTWNNHELYVKPKEKCFHINKCWACKNLRLFSDSLPYILDRNDYLERSQLEMPEIEFAQLFLSEYKALKWVVKNWGNKEEIKSARKFLRQYKPLLPKDLSSLIPVMKLVAEQSGKKEFWEE